jgi:hypothetical protein
MKAITLFFLAEQMTINDYYYRINKFLPRASESGSHPYYLK